MPVDSGAFLRVVQAFWKLRTCLCVCQALNRDEMMAIDRDSEEEDEEEDEESEVHATGSCDEGSCDEGSGVGILSAGCWLCRRRWRSRRRRTKKRRCDSHLIFAKCFGQG